MLVYAGFFFAVFVTAVVVFLQVQNQELSRAENAYAQEIAYGFADSMHTAFVAGPGFSGTLTLPKDILGKRYWLAVSYSPNAAALETGIVYVEWMSGGKNSSFSAPTITANYTPKTDGYGFVTAKDYGTRKFVMVDAAQGFPLNITNEGGGIRIMKG
ncbi:MAG: hypothetical protein WC717_03780 [Candidatus Micrarchaeia archaeon]|jgi:hypothetical protein